MKKLYEFCIENYKKYKEIINYLISGVIATVLNIGIFALFNLWLGEDLYLVSNAISIIAAVLFQYFSNKFFVFEHKKMTMKENLLEFSKFISCRFITAMLDMGVMFVGVSILKVNEMIMKVITNVIVVILNYIFSKLFVFKNKTEEL